MTKDIILVAQGSGYDELWKRPTPPNFDLYAIRTNDDDTLKLILSGGSFMDVPEVSFILNEEFYAPDGSPPNPHAMGRMGIWNIDYAKEVIKNSFENEKSILRQNNFDIKTPIYHWQYTLASELLKV